LVWCWWMHRQLEASRFIDQIKGLIAHSVPNCCCKGWTDWIGKPAKIVHGQLSYSLWYSRWCTCTVITHWC
jgi:hypothetical protein